MIEDPPPIKHMISTLFGGVIRCCSATQARIDKEAAHFQLPSRLTSTALLIYLLSFFLWPPAGLLTPFQASLTFSTAKPGVNPPLLPSEGIGFLLSRPWAHKYTTCLWQLLP